jgi:hypothetical protein
MPIIPCPTCDKKLRVPDDAAGKRIQCPSCKMITTITHVPAQGMTASKPEPIPVAPRSRPKPPEIDVDLLPVWNSSTGLGFSIHVSSQERF